MSMKAFVDSVVDHRWELITDEQLEKISKELFLQLGYVMLSQDKETCIETLRIVYEYGHARGAWEEAP